MLAVLGAKTAYSRSVQVGWLAVDRPPPHAHFETILYLVYARARLRFRCAAREYLSRTARCTLLFGWSALRARSTATATMALFTTLTTPSVALRCERAATRARMLQCSAISIVTLATFSTWANYKQRGGLMPMICRRMDGRRRKKAGGSSEAAARRCCRRRHHREPSRMVSPRRP